MSLDVHLMENGEEIYWANITHNLNTMAGKAGIYKHLWRPEELDIHSAIELIAPLRNGLARLTEAPTFYKQFNPDNGWGSWEGLVAFTSGYLEACIAHPHAMIRVSR